MKIRKTLILLFIPFFTYGQFLGTPTNEKVDEYYVDGKTIIKQTWKDKEQAKTVMEITSESTSEWRFFIQENNVEIGTNFSIVREYGKYIKVSISVINKSNESVDLLPTNMNVTVKSDLIDKEMYEPLLFSQYNKKVKRRQSGNSILAGTLVGISNATMGMTYSQNTSFYSNGNTSGLIFTNTTAYSPTLAAMQIEQNSRELDNLQKSQLEDIKYINNGYLQANTIFPNTIYECYFLIPYHKKINDIDMVINLGEMSFSFHSEKWQWVFNKS